MLFQLWPAALARSTVACKAASAADDNSCAAAMAASGELAQGRVSSSARRPAVSRTVLATGSAVPAKPLTMSSLT